MSTKPRAVFCDRDGVINLDLGYVHKWEHFEFYPGVPQALSKLKENGWLLVLVTNQSGIARGFFDEQDFHCLTAKMQESLKENRAHFDAIYFCPHLPHGVVPVFSRTCRCRKPGPGMFERAKLDLGLDMTASVCIGDKPTDIEAARAAGITRTYGVGTPECFNEYSPDFQFNEPVAALEAIARLK